MATYVWNIKEVYKKTRANIWSPGTRGLFGGGAISPAFINTVGYVTVETTGDATDFGDLTVGRDQLSGRSSSTRGLFGGG